MKEVWIKTMQKLISMKRKSILSSKQRYQYNDSIRLIIMRIRDIDK